MSMAAVLRLDLREEIERLWPHSILVRGVPLNMGFYSSAGAKVGSVRMNSGGESPSRWESGAPRQSTSFSIQILSARAKISVPPFIA